MKQNILVIDTSDNKKIKVAVEIDNKIVAFIEESNKLRSQATLIVIESALKKAKLEPKDLSGIKINTGPGSFTGLRIGISIANTFSYLLKIPINGKKIGELETAVYN